MVNAALIRQGCNEGKGKIYLKLKCHILLQKDEIKQNYEQLKKNYLKLEDVLKTQSTDEELAYTSTQKGVNMKASMDARERLLDNHGNLYAQDD